MLKKRPYIIKQYDSTAFVVILGYSRIDEYVSLINKDLSDLKFKGELIFDLLLSNGLSQRFFSAEFHESKIKLSSFKKKQSIEFQFKQTSASIFLKHKSLFKKDFLPSNLLEKIQSEIIA